MFFIYVYFIDVIILKQINLIIFLMVFNELQCDKRFFVFSHFVKKNLTLHLKKKF